MSCSALSATQMGRWSRWLSSSHGLTELPDHVIYQCDFESMLYLTPMPKLPGFAMRQEREVEGIIATFEIAPGVRTIANLWGEQIFDLRRIRHPGDLTDAKQRVLDAASEGRLWWGTERLVGFPDFTSVCYVFPEGAQLPVPIAKLLKAEEPSSPIQVTVDLV